MRAKPIKPTSRDVRFQKLRALRCFGELYERICSGWSLPEVARFVQEERKEYTDIKRSQLEFQLREFRKIIPAGDLVAKRFPEVFEKAKEQVVQGVVELNELTELYRIQMTRIGIDFSTEKKINKLMPSMTSEVREARQLLESMAQLKLDMGLVDRAPDRVDVHVDGAVEAVLAGPEMDEYPESVKEVLKNPESRRRVKGIVDRFVKLGAKSSAVASALAAPIESEDDENLDEAVSQ